MQEWMPTDSGFDNGESIGLTPEELEIWRSPGFMVLEVGTGTNATTLQELRKMGVNAIGIEPGILNGDSNKYSSLIKEQGLFDKLMKRPALNKLVQPYYLKDISKHTLIPEEGVDVVFAKSANFAQYAQNKQDLLQSIMSALSVLKKNKESYLTFFSLKDDLVFQMRESMDLFNLKEFLDSQGAKYQIRETKIGFPYVVIYRLNGNIDFADRLNNYLAENI